MHTGSGASVDDEMVITGQLDVAQQLAELGAGGQSTNRHNQRAGRASQTDASIGRQKPGTAGDGHPRDVQQECECEVGMENTVPRARVPLLLRSPQAQLQLGHRPAQLDPLSLEHGGQSLIPLPGGRELTRGPPLQHGL